MTSIDFLKMSLAVSNDWIFGLAKDMADAPLTLPTPKGGNHPLWCVCHLAYSEANFVSVLVKGEKHPFPEWEEIFKPGSEVSNDAAKYPSYEEALKKLEEVRAATLTFLETLTEADLDKPSHAEGEMKEWFGTVGVCLSIIPIHFAFHGGQIADARRAAGRPPMMG